MATTVRTTPPGIYISARSTRSQSPQPVDELDPVIIAKRISDSRKAQVPYNTGWDAKPNSCLKLVADIESEDHRRRKVVLARACAVLEIGDQRRKYSQVNDDQGRNAGTSCTISSQSKNLASSSKTKEVKVAVASTKELEDYIRTKDGDYDHYRDFPVDLPDDYEDSSDLSLHCIDSTIADSSLNQSFKSLLISPSPSSFDHLNISEIKSDSSRGDASSLRNKSKSSLKSKSALSSSTPVRGSVVKKVHFEGDSELEDIPVVPERKSGTFTIFDDEEYDDDEESSGNTKTASKESPPCLHIQSPIHVQMQKSLDEYERERIVKWKEDVEAKMREMMRPVDKVDGSSATNADINSASDEALKMLFLRCEARRVELAANLEKERKLQQLQLEQEDRQIEAEKKLELERRKAQLDKEQADAQSSSLAAVEIREKELLQKQYEEKEAQIKTQEAAAAAEAYRIQEEAQEYQRLKEQQVLQVDRISKIAAANNAKAESQMVPPEFRNAVLQTDLYTYLKLQQRLEEVKDAVKEISSSNPRTKEFYFAAMKVINTPINSISNLSTEHLLQKIQHFIQLLEGKSVHIAGSMKKPFISTSEPNGDLFVQNLFAFRFVKKSEAEITRGMSGLTPLANLGVQLIRRFPSVGILIRANFYKVCPFLVPLIYPRTENMTNDQYASAIGHEQLGGTERTVQQVLLERLSGYCTLYGIMVNIVEKSQFSDLGTENIDFYSLKEIWRILVATMKLEPQVDVTCSVLLALLETSCDSLYLTFKSQFRKLMNELSSKYLRKIRNVTPPAQAAPLTRLELFLEAQVPKLR